MKRLKKVDFAVPVLLLVLSTIPILGGVLRLETLVNSPVSTSENARFLAAPIPIAIHVVAAALYSMLGAFQFSHGIRWRWPRWHRYTGRLIALCGLCAGLTGLWMTVFYAIPQNLQGTMLYAVRLLVGAAMVASLVMGCASILRRDVARHEAWMIRAYALGQGAGTQALMMGPWILIYGDVHGVERDLLMSAAWALNLAVAELIIRRGAQSVKSSRSTIGRVTAPA